MLSFLVIFPNPFIQAKLVTTKTWLLCYMGVSHFHQFFLWNEVRKEKCGEIFAYPLQLPLTPKAQTCQIFTIWFQSSTVHVGWSLIYCDFLWLSGSIGEAFLIKLWHFKNSLFPDASSHQECTTNWQWGHTKSFILKSKSHIHYQIVQLPFK